MTSIDEFVKQSKEYNIEKDTIIEDLRNEGLSYVSNSK